MALKSVPTTTGWGKPTLDLEKLGGLLQELQDLFDNVSGHDHSAADKGKAIITSGLASGAVTSGKLAAGAVTLGKAKVFVSAEQTGSGAEQSIAHGLSAIPAAVLVCLTEFGAAVAVDVAEGAHDGTNVKVTVTNAVKYKVLAWA